MKPYQEGRTDFQHATSVADEHEMVKWDREDEESDLVDIDVGANAGPDLDEDVAGLHTTEDEEFSDEYDFLLSTDNNDSNTQHANEIVNSTDDKLNDG